MNCKRKILIGLALLTFYSMSAFASDDGRQAKPSRRQGPPPEAYAACEGKIVGDAAQFTNRKGDTVLGTCEQRGDRLVLRPDNRPSKGNTNGRQQGPPPEAYTACEGKNSGDTAEFVNPRGETLTGTCVQEGDRLVLRPDCSKKNSGGQATTNTTD